ncbi:MAG TPA: hypothetical protein VER11_24605 [Polyangiaceae bacterium]|nr:hypothetical protein [Polyangiaceae bacterium]
MENPQKLPIERVSPAGVNPGNSGANSFERRDIVRRGGRRAKKSVTGFTRFLRSTNGWRMLFFALLTLWAASTHAAAKRKPQDYGGPPPPTVGPALLWVPRVVLFPPWLVSEYVVRQPIGALTRTAERDQWPEQVIGFFTFGERRQITLFPSALFDFGLKPSIGFNFGWKYFIAEPNSLRVHFGFWGPDWVTARVVDEYNLSDSQAVSFEGQFVRRKDLPFYGVGPESPSSPRLRYQAMTSQFSLGYRYDFWRSSALTTRIGMRTLSFGTGTCCGSQSIYDAVASGSIPEPPGLGDGYIAEFQGLSLAFDSRRPRPENGSGVRLDGHGEGVFAPAGGSHETRAWMAYGASAGAALDAGGGRVFGLGVNAELIDPLRGTVPFTDQVSLGGNKPMRGYLQGRLIDRSSLVARAQYTWPVWYYLNGVVQADVGNVFGPHFDGFEPALLRLSTAIGIRSNGSPDSGLEILVAGATDPLGNGFRYSSFRLVIGSHHGF